MDTEIKSSNWETKTLGEVCEVVGGGTPKTGIPEYWSDEIVWVTPKDLGQLSTVEIFDTNKYISKKGLEKSSAKLLPKGSVVMSSRAPIGYVAIAGVDLATNQGCRNFICHDNIFNKYLYYFLFANTELLNSLGGGATFREISGTTLKDIEIPVPPLSEQKRIVKILDEKFGVIEELQNITKKQIADAKELFESRLDEVYSSPDYNFGNLGDSVNIKTGKLNSNAAVVGGDYPFFTCSRQASQIDSYSFDCDAVLLAGNNASADFNVKHYKGKFDAYQRTYVITVLNNAELDIRFVYNLLLHGLAKFKESAVGAGTKFLKIGMIQDFQLPLFTLKEQKQIVKELDELSVKTKELETIFHQKIADLEELKKSYLADAFAGKL
jgi:type I restriction enzyme S subunit